MVERQRHRRPQPDEVKKTFGFSLGGEAAARRRLMRGEPTAAARERDAGWQAAPHPALRGHLPPKGEGLEIGGLP